VFVRTLALWVAMVARAPKFVLLVLSLASAVFGWISVDRFRINSDLSELIRQDTDWRQDFDHFQASFPDLARTAVIVVSSDSFKQLEIATDQIVAYLEGHPQYFSAIAALGHEPFFRDHALLYLDIDELDNMADRLASAQPWLSAVARDPSLISILDLVKEGVRSDPPEEFERTLLLIAESIEKTSRNEDGTIYWADELFALDETRYQLIFLKAKSDYGESLPDAMVIGELRDMVAVLDLPVDVRLTGEITLQHEEIEAAIEGVSLAGWLALALLLIILMVGVRSVKIVVATFLLLAIGVIWTSAYAMLAVGEYNTLSLVFVVMFFGLGVDFALHFSLRYQEAINSGDIGVVEALVSSSTSVGRAISLCTLTTAIGFLGFWPTQYQGLADLGVISAGGMAVAWFLTFTFLPAFYALVGSPRAHLMVLPTSDLMLKWLVDRRAWVIGCVIVGMSVATVLASQSRFDYSVLALKDPESESMSTLRLLQREGISTDYSLVVVSRDGVDKAKLLALPAVADVIVPASLVPEEQDEKLLVLVDTQTMLVDLFVGAPNVATDASVAEVKLRARALVEQIAATPGTEDLSQATLNRLGEALHVLQGMTDQAVEVAQAAVTGDLVKELEWIRRSLVVDRVDFGDIPETARNRVVARTGDQLSIIVPQEDTAEVSALTEFITDVRGLVPNATGRPVLEWGVGEIVIDSFQRAMVFAALGIGVVLLLTLRKLGTTLLVLLPLTLAAICTLAAGVMFNVPINMANILVLPLIFGLGVDNGIHVVERFLGEGGIERLMRSSTPRAVVLSTLTTLGAFASLSLSPHRGTASVGILLTIAICLLLLFTVVLLPVLLARKTATRSTST